MPRVRTVTAPDGFIYFSKGTPEDAILDFVETNKIESAETDRTTSPIGDVLLKVPVSTADGACVYEIPDHVYVWVCIPVAAVRSFVLR